MNWVIGIVMTLLAVAAGVVSACGHPIIGGCLAVLAGWFLGALVAKADLFDEIVRQMEGME